MPTLRILSLLLLGQSSLNGIVQEIAIIIGYFFLFRKCGLPGWHAFIPCYRSYALSRCADRKTDGRVLFVLRILLVLLNIVRLFVEESAQLMMEMITLVIISGIIVYQLRVYMGLTEVFGRKKILALLLVFFEPLAILIWGLSRKFQPQWKVQEIESEAEEYYSGKRSAVLENGLTVNLEKRTVISHLLEKKDLLRDIHMEIRPGRMVLLLGGSGAGKTTLVNAINGYEKADAEIRLNGVDIYKEYKKMQYSIGFVPQQDLMRGSDTAEHTLLDAATLRLPETFSSAERKRRVAEVMDIFGLKQNKDTMVDKMSGGQKKRLSIAMEFISNPTLFILDEPDSGLDGVMARELMQRLRSIADQGKIIIVITHTPDRVVDLFDDVIVLARDAHRTGRLAYFGTIENARVFFEREKMEQVVKCINREDEGGEGRGEDFIRKFAEAIWTA